MLLFELIYGLTYKHENLSFIGFDSWPGGAVISSHQQLCN